MQSKSVHVVGDRSQRVSSIAPIAHDLDELRSWRYRVFHAPRFGYGLLPSRIAQVNAALLQHGQTCLCAMRYHLALMLGKGRHDVNG